MIEKYVWLFLIVTPSSAENLTLVSQTRSGYLEKYQSYVDTVLMRFEIPKDALLASFKFRASEMSSSIFGCKPKDVTLNLKYGSPPIINPDGSPFPKKFLLDGRSEKHDLHFQSDKQYYYVNISRPVHGSYFAVAYYPYTDPQNEGITQEGLVPECHTYIDANVYVRETDSVKFIMPNVEINMTLRINETDFFKFFVPENVDYVTVHLKDMRLCDSCTKLRTILQNGDSPRSVNKTLWANETDTDRFLQFWITDSSYYYLTFSVENSAYDFDILGKFKFELKMIDYREDAPRNSTNATYLNALRKVYLSESFISPMPYKQYNLHKSFSSESFLYTYEMQPLIDGSIPISVNLTSDGFSVLKFHVKDVTDVGGSLQLILAFKPKLLKKGRYMQKEKMVSNYSVVACVSNVDQEIPTWEQSCNYNGVVTSSPLVLNKTNENDTLQISYPESGDWYLTFKLFCGDCEPCDCSPKCEASFRNCTGACLRGCATSGCDKCLKGCEEELKTNGCEGCDCDGDCKKVREECNTSIVFDISSYPCVSYGCGSNGKCGLLISEGFVHSACVCTNNYRGWDCSDGSKATSMSSLIMEMLLLVLSNLLFLPAVAVAYQRKYYVEMLVYFSTCFFSSFYHACDAGENVISFCIAKLNVLQYCDFYCALLSIWVTLIAIAHLPQPVPQLLHMGGAVLIGAGTTLDKTSMWVFLFPVSIGLVIIACSWGWKYYKDRVLFPSKRYLKIILPSGLLVVLIALIFYSVLQTQSNYKYVHSLWHVMMAVAVMILLPNMLTFLPNVQYL